MTEDEDDLFQDLLEHPQTTESSLPLNTSNMTYHSTTRLVTPPAPVDDRNENASAANR